MNFFWDSRYTRINDRSFSIFLFFYYYSCLMCFCVTIWFSTPFTFLIVQSTNLFSIYHFCIILPPTLLHRGFALRLPILFIDNMSLSLWLEYFFRIFSFLLSTKKKVGNYSKLLVLKKKVKKLKKSVDLIYFSFPFSY